MSPPSTEDDSIAILKRHQKVLTGELTDSELEPTQIIDPTPPTSDSKSHSLVPATPTRSTPVWPFSATTDPDAPSRDPTGNLCLHYSYSQIDLGETQPDTVGVQMVPSTAPDVCESLEPHAAIPLAIYTQSQCHPSHAPTSSPQPELVPFKAPSNSNGDGDVTMEDEMQTARETPFTFFPEARKFASANTPRRDSTPKNDYTPNPLAQLLGDSKPFSLTQAFNAASSPIGRLGSSESLSSQPPPTPSIHAATIMAKSMPKIFDNQCSTPAQPSPMELDDVPAEGTKRSSLSPSPVDPQRPSDQSLGPDEVEVTGEAVKTPLTRRLPNAWAKAELNRASSSCSRDTIATPSRRKVLKPTSGRTEPAPPICSSPPPRTLTDSNDESGEDSHELQQLKLRRAKTRREKGTEELRNTRFRAESKSQRKARLVFEDEDDLFVHHRPKSAEQDTESEEEESRLPPVPNTQWDREDERERFKRLTSQPAPEAQTTQVRELEWYELGRRKTKGTRIASAPTTPRKPRLARKSPPLPSVTRPQQSIQSIEGETTASEEAVTQIPASDPPEPDPLVRMANVEAFWENAHNFQPAMAMRRTKSTSTMARPDTGDIKLLHRSTLPVTQQDSAIKGRLGIRGKPIPLTQLPPFNIPTFSPPTPPPNGEVAPTGNMPEMIRESSNLIPQVEPHSSLTPGPSSDLASPDTSMQDEQVTTAMKDADPKLSSVAQSPVISRIRGGFTTIPATSCRTEDGLLSPDMPSRTVCSTPDLASNCNRNVECNDSPTRKRKRDSRSTQLEPHAVTPPAEEDPPRVRDQLRKFSSLDVNSTPLFSSREEPNEVDMIGIVRDIGAGDLEELRILEPAPEKEIEVRASKRRKSSMPSEKTRDDRESRSASPAAEDTSIPAITIAKAKERAPKVVESSAVSVRTSIKRTSKQEIRKKPRISLPKRATGKAGSLSLTYPAPSRATDSDDTADILSTTDPRYHVSTSVSTSTNSAIEPQTPPPITAPHRVFALFKDKNLFYHPATLLSLSTESHTQVRVAFDDGTETALERTCIRSLDLRIGDIVRVDLPNMKRQLWMVKGFSKPREGEAQTKLTDNRGRKSVFVVQKVAAGKLAGKQQSTSARRQGQAETRVEVPITNIYLPQSLWGQFAKRDDTATIRIPLSARGGLRPSPGPESQNRRTTPHPAVIATAASSFNTPRANAATGIFANMLFMLSFGEKEAEKRNVQKQIINNGGRILESTFEDLFSAPSYSSLATSMIATVANNAPSSTSTDSPPLPLLPQYQPLGFTAVITTTHSRRTKFLEALALGIPCLHPRWILDSVKRRQPIQDWHTYLLPSGESSYLGTGVIRSRYLPPYDPSTILFNDVVKERPKMLLGKRVLVVVPNSGSNFSGNMASATTSSSVSMSVSVPTSPAVAEKRKVIRFLLRALGAQEVRPVKAADVEATVMGKRGVGGAGTEKWDLVVAEGGKETGSGKGGGALAGFVGRKWQGKVVREEVVIQSLILGRWVE